MYIYIYIPVFYDTPLRTWHIRNVQKQILRVLRKLCDVITCPCPRTSLKRQVTLFSDLVKSRSCEICSLDSLWANNCVWTQQLHKNSVCNLVTWKGLWDFMTRFDIGCFVNIKKAFCQKSFGSSIYVTMKHTECFSWHHKKVSKKDDNCFLACPRIATF